MAKKAEKEEKKRGALGAAADGTNLKIRVADSVKAYDASSIQVLEGLDPVRKRPGMYIGTTGPEGLHHLIWEIFDNARDEAMGGYADDIEVALLPDGYVRVTDNGRGIPVGIHPKTKVSALETIMTTLHAGGKFGGEDSGYKVSGGLHGVGASVVNALSLHTMATVYQDGGIHTQEYKMGKPMAKVKKIGTSARHGTIISFKPDASIFKEGVEWDWARIVAHLRQQAYLVKGTRIAVIDARTLADVADTDCFYLRDLPAQAGLALEAPSMTFYFEGGLKSLVAFQTSRQEPVHKNIFYVDKEQDGVMVEVALQYIDDITSRISAFANNTYNAEGGTHVTGFKTALTRTLNTYGRNANMLKDKDENFTGEDVLEGLVAVISVKLPEIQFEGQTKAKLGSTEATGAVSAILAEALGAFLEEHPEDARTIINKVQLALKARKAAKAAKDSVLRKGALEGMTLPGKLADCQVKNAEEAELFIVEGESAGGSSKQGRDRRTQAILPLKGKILNVERARIDRMLASVEIRALVIAMGTAIGDVFDITKLRYHKIIIATDADVDGAHIRTLLLTLLYRHFRPIIEGGFVYIAQPPLYKITKGKSIVYAYTDKEKESVLKELDEANVQRYKGLGEMNPNELWETTMDPARRVLKRVRVEDAEAADRIFDILMGTDVASRKSFIQSNARLATLDV
ncbi:MAG: DNA topoisomerase subunit B [bacterium]|nr:DNA topoisomerase subunit B [bacterium]